MDDSDQDNISTSSQVLSPQLIALVRQKGATRILDTLCSWMTKIHHSESGKIIESVVQVLSDKDFDILGALCIGYEKEDLVQQLAASVVVRLASKLGLNILEYEQYLNASKNFLLLVNAEARRRNGDVLYTFPNNLFNDITDQHFIMLTPAGKEKMIDELLIKFNSEFKQ